MKINHKDFTSIYTFFAVLILSACSLRAADTPTYIELRTEVEGITDADYTAVFGAFFSPDGKKVVIARHGFAPRIWDVDSGKELHALWDGGHPLLSPDGTKIAVTGGGSVRIWEFDSGKELYNLEGHRGFISSQFSPDGKKIITADNDTVRVWDVESGEKLHEWEGGVSLPFAGGERTWSPMGIFSPDSKRVATITHRPHHGSPQDGGRFVESLFQFRDVNSGRVLHNLEVPSHAMHNPIFSPDWEKFASFTVSSTGLSDSGGTVHIWDADSGEEMQKLEMPPRTYTYIRMVIEIHEEVTDEGQVSYVERAREVQETRSSNYIPVVNFSPDGKKIVTVHPNAIRIWDVDFGKELHRLDGVSNWFSLLASANLPAWKRVATTDDNNVVRIWCVDSGKELHRLEGHSDFISVVVLSPDGKRVVTGSSDGTARIWLLE